MYLKKIMAATFAATALAGQAQEKTFSIIPEPVEITVTDRESIWFNVIRSFVCQN